MRAGIGLVLRGLWWRRGLTSAVLAVAVVTTTAAALGPLYARAAAESTLQDQLTQATWTVGLHISGDVDVSTAGAVDRVAARMPKPGQVPGYDHRIEGIRTTRDLGVGLVGTNLDLLASLVWRQGICQHVVIVSGHCPDGPGQALVSQRTVSPASSSSLYLGKHRLRIGSKLTTTAFLDSTSPWLPAQGTASVQVVGVYRPKAYDSSYWFGHSYFDQKSGSDYPPAPPTIDALIVSRSTMVSLKRTGYAAVDFDYPLTPSAVRLSNETAERAAVAALVKHPPAAHGFTNQYGIRAGGFTVSTDLGKVLDAADHEHHLVDIGTLLVTLQLALLAWLVLFQVVSDAIEARGSEIAMAKLRGHRPAGTVRFGLGEPVLLLALAVPLGLAAAFGVTHLFAATAFVAGVPVVLPWAAVGTALVAFAGGLLAAVLAGYRTLTRSVLEQWRRTTRRPGHGPLLVVADVLLAGAALAGFFWLRADQQAGSTDDSVALLTPGLLVFAVALIGVRLLPLGCRWLAQVTRASRRVGTFLASRQVARRPVGLRLAALLAVAVGLATFAVAGETVATANRTARAHGEVGADRVASVAFDPGVDPVAATERADPKGRWAMAAATWLPDGGNSVNGYLLGVDSRRLVAAGYPAAGGPSTAQLARILGTSTVAPIRITASHLRVHLTAAGLTGDRRPYLTVNLRTPRNPYYLVDSHTIAEGSDTFVVPVKCTASCTLLGLSWNRPVEAGNAESGTITLTGIDTGDGTTWSPLPIGLGVAHSWRAGVPQGLATDHVTVTDAGIVDAFSNRLGGYGGIDFGAAPSPMPAVATRQAIAAASILPHPPQIIDASNTTALFRVERYVPVLPAVLDNGVMMDVRYLMTELPDFTGEATWQVWIGPHAPPDAIARLRAAGLQVETVRHVSTRIGELSRQGPALALLLLLACAIAGAVLAVGGTAISISASSRRRSYEIAALQAVGVRRRSLLRASVIEQLLLLGTAVVLGVPTGLLAARLAMPVIPEFADHTPIALYYTPHWLPTLAFAAGFVVLLTVTALIAARALIRLALPSRLREAGQ